MPDIEPQKPITVKVLTYDKSDLENPINKQYKVITGTDARSDFFKHLVWAMLNGKMLEIFNADDEPVFD